MTPTRESAQGQPTSDVDRAAGDLPDGAMELNTPVGGPLRGAPYQRSPKRAGAAPPSWWRAVRLRGTSTAVSPPRCGSLTGRRRSAPIPSSGTDSAIAIRGPTPSPITAFVTSITMPPMARPDQARRRGRHVADAHVAASGRLRHEVREQRPVHRQEHAEPRAQDEPAEHGHGQRRRDGDDREPDGAHDARGVDHGLAPDPVRGASGGHHRDDVAQDRRAQHGQHRHVRCPPARCRTTGRSRRSRS